MLAIESPYPQFFELDGRPLDAGFVYIGEENQNPETAPLTVYWDTALTIPAPQPLRTLNGMLARDGTPAFVYAASDHSMMVRDSRQRQVVYALSSQQFSVSGQIDAFEASLAAPSGAGLVGFIQTGAGAVKRSVKSKLDEVYDLADDGTVDLTGNVAATAVFNASAADAAARGMPLRLPAGTILLDPISLPPNLPGLFGAGEFATVLKFKRTGLTPGQVLLDGINNTVALSLAEFAIDCDDAAFKTAAVKPINISGSNGAAINRVRIIGRGDAAIYADGIDGADITETTVNCTGASGSSFVAALYMSNADSVTARRLRIAGLPNYGGGFATGSKNCSFVDCHVEDGTASGFGFWFDGASRSSIESCTAKNTYAEAFQITNGSYNFIGVNSASWDNSAGIDAGISVHATAGNSASYNIVFGNTLDNSKHAGLLVANNAVYNLFECNILHQCGVRGTAAGQTGSAFCAMAAYSDIAGANCSTNTFRHNKVVIESGAVTYGYGEFNTGGGGSNVVLTKAWENEFHAAGGVITNRYLLVSQSSYAADLDWVTFAPTVAAAAGAIGAFTVNSAKFRRRGESTEMTLDITITTAGTGSSGLVVTWSGAVPAAGTNSGSLCGCVLSGKGVAGSVNSNGVVLLCADASTPIVNGARIVVSGLYRVV